MRAAVLESPGSPMVIYDDVAVEDPHAGEVAVQVTHCGVCHSDLSLIDGQLPALCPTVLGHEAAGIVTALGPGVTSLAVGDHVVITPCPPCGRCYFCVRGEWSICVNSRALMTSSHPDGGTRLSRAGATVYRGVGVAAFAETVITEETGAVKIPDDVPLDVACVLGCAVQTGVGAVIHTANVEPGATVLVMGLGGVGQSVVQGARIAGASQIIVSDPVAERRELAMKLGATHALDPGSDDVVGACLDLTTGIGVDYSFDAVGRNALVCTGIDASRVGGTTVMVGVPPIDEAFTYPSGTIFAAMAKNVLGCLLGSVNSLRDIPNFIALWRSGQLDLESLITGQRPFDELNTAVDDLRESRGVRTVVEISRPS